MYRKLVMAIGVALAIGGGVVLPTAVLVGAMSSGAMASGAEFTGPGPGVTGNYTGGIFPYSPDVEPIYRRIAADYCAHYGRLAKVTSIHRKYGDYVSFTCYDRPGRYL